MGEGAEQKPFPNPSLTKITLNFSLTLVSHDYTPQTPTNTLVILSFQLGKKARKFFSLTSLQHLEKAQSKTIFPPLNTAKTASHTEKEKTKNQILQLVLVVVPLQG